MKPRTRSYRQPPVLNVYRNALLTGPTCSTCTHRSCRARRAERQPRLGGLRTEFSAEHVTVALCQARNPHVLSWYGEATQSYWLATPAGLIEAKDAEDLFRLVSTVNQLPERASRRPRRLSA